MNFTILSTEGDVSLAIDDSRQLMCPVYWPFTEIHASLERDSDDLHRYTGTEFAGSSHFLGDEGFVFEADGSALTGVFLRVPEVNFDGQASLESWLRAREIAGVPKLKKRGKFTVRSPSQHRYLSPAGDYLLCTSHEARFPRKGLRVAISSRVTLLLEDGVYSGCLIRQPVRGLVRFDAAFAEGDKDIDVQFLVEPLRDYLEAVQEPMWHLLEQGDVALRSRLEDVLNRLASYPDSIEPVHALRDRCRVLLEDYFVD